MGMFGAIGSALGAPLRAPGMSAITKPINAGLSRTPGLRSVPGAMGFRQQQQPMQSKGIGPSQNPASMMGGAMRARMGQQQPPMGQQMGGIQSDTKAKAWEVPGGGTSWDSMMENMNKQFGSWGQKPMQPQMPQQQAPADMPMMENPNAIPGQMPQIEGPIRQLQGQMQNSEEQIMWNNYMRNQQPRTPFMGGQEYGMGQGMAPRNEALQQMMQQYMTPIRRPMAQMQQPEMY